MATYNGEKFITEQIYSILIQLSSEDEVIVVDDYSTDNTVKIIERLNDSRIKIYLNNQNKGHVYSFNRSISLAKNDIILMSDQDDIWIHGRVELIVKKIRETGVSLVSSNFGYINANGEDISDPVYQLKETDSDKHIKNLLKILTGKIPYYGCSMGFKRDFVNLILPIPCFVESHDLWITLASNLIRSNIHIEERTLQRRIHQNNASEIRRGLRPKLWSRIIFLRSLFLLSYRQCLITLKRKQLSY